MRCVSGSVLRVISMHPISHLGDESESCILRQTSESDLDENATKVKALEKLGTMDVQVGYPEEWQNYSLLEIKNDSYVMNVLRAGRIQFNHGAIGAIIGHEMTHGFDDQGRKFDKNGNMTDWWTEQDGSNFNNSTNMLIGQYANFEALPGLHRRIEILFSCQKISRHYAIAVAIWADKQTLVMNRHISGYLLGSSASKVR